MSKGLRLTEKWMHRGLWLVALAFAFFLIGLGGKVVENMELLAPVPSAESFLDQAKAKPLQDEIKRAEEAASAANDAREQAQQKHETASANTKSARESFDNWIATRQATVRPEQDAELIARTRKLDELVATERAALAEVEAQKQAALDARQAMERANNDFEQLLEPARRAAWEAEQRAILQVFLYRLALTLPLLLAAGWLFKRKRKASYWPFVWGFMIFALFAFFFELVPYLPSYGGYVRYIVGLALTIGVGRYAIRWLQSYLARQREVEALPAAQRRATMRYDIALGRIGKNLCPSCERKVDYKDGALNNCPHCGLGLFDNCSACQARKNALARFCLSCGTPSKVSMPD